jgi:hypothetical protein
MFSSEFTARIQLMLKRNLLVKTLITTLKLSAIHNFHSISRICIGSSSECLFKLIQINQLQTLILSCLDGATVF